jgi:hypothetical protein
MLPQSLLVVRSVTDTLIACIERFSRHVDLFDRFDM